MKAYLTIATLFIAGVASAQNDNSYSELRKYRSLQNLETAKLLGTLANGNKLYALPQDNMPCIVPEMKQFTMPNAGNNIKKDQVPGAIPNPAPKIIIPPSAKKASAPIYIDLRKNPIP